MKFFKKIIIPLFLLLILFSSCKHEKPVDASAKLTEQQYTQQIDSMEKILYSNAGKGFDKDAALKTVNLYDNSVKEYPSMKAAPDYLFKAGELSSSMNNSKEAIAFFKKAYNDYPDYSKAVMCLFLQAFIYENQLHELGPAEQLYREVIYRFPNDKIALDAKACINNLGKTDEELIREFEAKANQ